MNKKVLPKELTINDFDKCVHNRTKTSITKEQISFRRINHKIYAVISNKISMRNPNGQYK